MFIPTFPTMEQAVRYAEIHTPLKTVMDHPAFISIPQYGNKAYIAATDCWEGAKNGDQAKMLKAMRTLSWALPPSCFGR